MIQALCKPEYLFRPQQLLLRLYRKLQPTTDIKRTLLPWKYSLNLNPQETVGKAIWHLGVYDLVLSEALWRLTSPGETAIDAGANIGYISSLLSARVGNSGSVYCFEPQPEIAKLLRENISLWPKQNCHFYEVALSDCTGQANLIMPKDYKKNQGVAYLDKVGNSTENSLTVPTQRLDYFFKDKTPQVMKVDVEGHEYSLFQGAGELITKKKIRDILFEEHQSYPTEAMTYLEKNGYALLRIKRSFLGPRCSDARTDHEKPKWEAPNILATTDPNRAQLILKSIGWQVLRI